MDTTIPEYFTESDLKETQKRKKWSLHDVKSIKALTAGQSDLIQSYFNNENGHIVATGSAGTGKSYLSVWLALNSILSSETKQKRIIIVRSNVSTGKDVGHLPGELEDKMAPFEAPYKDILHDLVGRASTYDDMKAARLIEFMPVAFIRGLTWDDAIIIVDEAQNMDFMTIHSVMTRVGKNSRIIVCADKSQDDLIHDRVCSGYDKMMRLFSTMNSVDVVTFTKHDIVRSGFAKEWVIACEEHS